MSAKTIIALTLSFVLSVGIGLFFGNSFVSSMKEGAQPVIFDKLIEEDLSDVNPPDGGKAPSDFNALYNYRYAKSKLNAATKVSVVVEGDVYSIMGEHQVVRGSKKFDGTDYFLESRSEGTFAKVYLRCFHTVGTDTVKTTGEYNGGKWGAYGDMQLSGENGYIEQKGSKPNEFIPYVINKDSVVEQGPIEEIDGQYKMKFILDPKIGGNNYKRYLKNSAGSIIMPVHSLLNFTLTVDENWNIKQIFIEETYTIKKDMGVMGVITAECRSTSTETYTIGQDVVISDKERP